MVHSCPRGRTSEKFISRDARVPILLNIGAIFRGAPPSAASLGVIILALRPLLIFPTKEWLPAINVY